MRHSPNEQQARQPSANDNIQGIRVIRLPRVLEKTGLSRSQIYWLMSQDRFPKQVSLSARAVGWNEVAVDAWIESRFATPE